MSRVASIIAAFAVWAVSSGLLLIMCVLSFNRTIVSSALIIAAGTLIGSAIAFATEHDKLGLAVAAGPAFVVAALLLIFTILGNLD